MGIWEWISSAEIRTQPLKIPVLFSHFCWHWHICPFCRQIFPPISRTAHKNDPRGFSIHIYIYHYRLLFPLYIYVYIYIYIIFHYIYYKSTGCQSTEEQWWHCCRSAVPWSPQNRTLTTRITRKTSGADGAWPGLGRQHPHRSIHGNSTT